MAIKIKPIKSFLVLVISLSSGVQVFSQQWLGSAISNYGGTNAAYTNPASLGGNEYKMYVNGVGLGLNIINDYISWGAPFTVSDYMNDKVPAQYKDSTGAVQFRPEWLKENLNGKSKNFYVEAELRGPAFMYRLNEKMAVAFSMKNRTGITFTNVDQSMARIAIHGIDSSNGNVLFTPPNNLSFGQPLGNLTFNMNALSYQEFALSFGTEVIEVKSFKIKAGVSAKLLVGNANAYAQVNDMDLQISGFDSLRVNNADFAYGYNNPDIVSNFNAKDLLPSFSSNLGFAWDAGVMVEYSPKVANNLTSKKTNYLFKAGLSLVDMGSISFKKNTKAFTVKSKAPFTFVRDSTTDAATEDGITSDKAVEYYDSIANVYFNIAQQNPLVYHLPSMLSLQFDFNIFKSFFLGAIVYQDIRGIKFDKITLHRPSQITILPRFEHKHIEVAIPITLGGDYKDFQVGGFVRVGPVFVGSDNLKSIITQKDFYGVNTYFGFAKGIGANKKKKTDVISASIVLPVGLY